jgi:co-chaperonin GroES (HSP10)
VEQSKYLKAFQTVSESGKGTYQLIGDCILVEVIKEDEFKTKSGLILSSGNARQVNGIEANKPTWVRILLTGEGYYNDKDGTMEEVPLDSKPGDIALVSANSIKYFSVFGPIVAVGQTQLGLIRESDIQMRFPGDVGFNKFFEIVNASLT